MTGDPYVPKSVDSPPSLTPLQLYFKKWALERYASTPFPWRSQIEAAVRFMPDVPTALRLKDKTADRLKRRLFDTGFIKRFMEEHNQQVRKILQIKRHMRTLKRRRRTTLRRGGRARRSPRPRRRRSGPASPHKRDLVRIAPQLLPPQSPEQSPQTMRAHHRGHQRRGRW